jgi:FHS family L-fucose permease-like MFS transporter
VYIVGIGFSLQQTSAQPFAASLGEPSSASNRLNLAGGVNSLGTTIGPIVVSGALFGVVAGVNDDFIKEFAQKEGSLNSMKTLYMFVGGLFLLAAALFYFSKKLPSGKSDATFAPANKAMQILIAITVILAIIFGVLYYTNVINGTLAIVLGLLAVVFILTSFMSFCPLYLPFGITTRRK